LVVLSADNEEHLLKIADKLSTRGIEHEMFHEPWWDMGYSALATSPIYGKDRKLLNKLPLWGMLDMSSHINTGNTITGNKGDNNGTN